MKYIVGIGGGGGRVGETLYKKLKQNIPVIFLAFSTSVEDNTNIDKKITSIISVINEGAGKSFLQGEELWNKSEIQQKIKEYFTAITENDEIILIASAGGGSGSSSLKTFVSILEKKTKKISIVCLIPHEESLNFFVNYYLCLNQLLELEDKATILLISNKFYLNNNENNIFKANEEICNKIISIFFLKDLDSKQQTNVFAIDEMDYKEIVWKPGFINIKELEKLSLSEKNSSLELYGNIRLVKRLLVFYNLKPTTSKNLEEFSKKFQTEIENFIKKFAKHIVIHYGILRSNYLNNESYYIIASGLSIKNLLLQAQMFINSNLEKFKNLKINLSLEDINKIQKKNLDLRKV